MNSGTFHVMAQEWRYYSREKSLIHTLHLSQLVTPKPGDTVLILPVPPAGRLQSRGIPPLPVPPQPYYGGGGNIITNVSMVSDCYGFVNWMGQIVTQSKMSITVDWGGDTIIMSPQDPGYFVVHVEGQTDVRTLGYQGPSSDGAGTVQILEGSNIIAQTTRKIFMGGAGWNVNQYIDSYLSFAAEALVPNATYTGKGIGLGTHSLGSPSSAFISMWMFKVGNI